MQLAFGLGWQQARLLELLQSLSELPPAVTSYHTVTSNPQQSHFVFKHRLHFTIVFTNNVGPGQAASLLQDICCSHHTFSINLSVCILNYVQPRILVVLYHAIIQNITYIYINCVCKVDFTKLMQEFPHV